MQIDEVQIDFRAAGFKTVYSVCEVKWEFSEHPACCASVKSLSLYISQLRVFLLYMPKE